MLKSVWASKSQDTAADRRWACFRGEAVRDEATSAAPSDEAWVETVDAAEASDDSDDCDVVPESPRSIVMAGICRGDEGKLWSSRGGNAKSREVMRS